eukprot:CAMPEP_0179882370 /NCGR_PEP_ID=MMETSP0982-20121206/28112_1 /TAXON_ID=483367 /ORGANISM="non described non described, Strain CCMP 2436" /LENGTH=69 /DNA_ID=CAMNT_0021776681 /DNA_START=131 /DNA_END=340 /DNA_ORIENTATION=+
MNGSVLRALNWSATCPSTDMGPSARASAWKRAKGAANAPSADVSVRLPARPVSAPGRAGAAGPPTVFYL